MWSSLSVDQYVLQVPPKTKLLLSASVLHMMLEIWFSFGQYCFFKSDARTRLNVLKPHTCTNQLMAHVLGYVLFMVAIYWMFYATKFNSEHVDLQFWQSFSYYIVASHVLNLKLAHKQHIKSSLVVDLDHYIWSESGSWAGPPYGMFGAIDCWSLFNHIQLIDLSKDLYIYSLLQEKGAERMGSHKNLYTVKSEMKYGTKVYCIEHYFCISSNGKLVLY